MAITITSGITIGPGINIGTSGPAPGPSFTLALADLNANNPDAFEAFGGGIINYYNLGFDYDNPGGPTGNYVIVNSNFLLNAQGTPVVSAIISSAKKEEIIALWADNNLIANIFTWYMFNVDFAYDSSVKVAMCLYINPNEVNSITLQMAPVYTGDTAWSTDGESAYLVFPAGPAPSGQGYKFPATFTLITPSISHSA